MSYSKKYKCYRVPEWHRSKVGETCTDLQAKCNSSCYDHHRHQCYSSCIYADGWNDPHTWYEFAKKWCEARGWETLEDPLTGEVYCFEFDELSSKLYPGQPKHIGLDTCQIVTVSENSLINVQLNGSTYRNAKKNTDNAREVALQSLSRCMEVEFLDGRVLEFDSNKSAREYIGVSGTTMNRWLYHGSTGYRRHGIKSITYK